MRPAPILVLALVLSASLGCHRAIESICRQTCDCKPCTDADLDACIEKGEKGTEAATKANCTQELDAYLDCADENLSCRQGGLPGTDKCATFEASLIACAGTGNPFATVCQESAEKFAMCVNSPPPQDTGACSGQVECQAKCMLEASCDAIIGNVFDNKFQECTNGCFNGK